MKVWKEMENKLFICIWEETRHLSKFSLHSLHTALKLCYRVVPESQNCRFKVSGRQPNVQMSRQ